MSAHITFHALVLSIAAFCVVTPAQSRDVLASVDVTRARTRIGPPIHRLSPSPRGPVALQVTPPHGAREPVAKGGRQKAPGERLERRAESELERVQERFDALLSDSAAQVAGDPTIDRAAARLEQAHLAAGLEDWSTVKRSVDAARALVTAVEKAELPDGVDLKDDAFSHLERVQALSERAARKVPVHDVVLEEARVCRDRGIADIGNEDWSRARAALVHAEGLFRLSLRHNADPRVPRRPEGEKRRRIRRGSGPVPGAEHLPQPIPGDAAEGIARLDELIADHGATASDRSAHLLEKVIAQRDLATQELIAGNEEEAARSAARGLRLGFRLAEERPLAAPERAAEALGRLDELVSVAEERTAALADDAPERGLLVTATARLEEARAAIEADDPAGALEAAHVGQDLVFEILALTRPAFR